MIDISHRLRMKGKKRSIYGIFRTCWGAGPRRVKNYGKEHAAPDRADARRHRARRAKRQARRLPSSSSIIPDGRHPPPWRPPHRARPMAHPALDLPPSSTAVPNQSPVAAPCRFAKSSMSVSPMKSGLYTARTVSMPFASGTGNFRVWNFRAVASRRSASRTGYSCTSRRSSPRPTSFPSRAPACRSRTRCSGCS